MDTKHLLASHIEMCSAVVYFPAGTFLSEEKILKCMELLRSWNWYK